MGRLHINSSISKLHSKLFPSENIVVPPPIVICCKNHTANVENNLSVRQIIKNIFHFSDTAAHNHQSLLPVCEKDYCSQ